MAKRRRSDDMEDRIIKKELKDDVVNILSSLLLGDKENIKDDKGMGESGSESGTDKDDRSTGGIIMDRLSSDNSEVNLSLGEDNGEVDLEKISLGDNNGKVYYDLGLLIDDIIKRRGSEDVILNRINDIVKIMRPLVILYDVNKFYLPEKNVIEKYIDALKELFIYHKDIFKYIFKIDKIIPINSANGRIFILRSMIRGGQSPKLLVKVALDKNVDPISYEYYVGLTLNKLRIDDNIEHFALMYGRFFCGLDPNIDVLKSSEDLEKVEICDTRYSKKSHLLYEFIRDIETDKVVTLSDYINELNNDEDTLQREINIVNIMILVLNALQQGQEKFNFTHYDLHAKNILVVKLIEKRDYVINYNDNKIIITTEVVPHIIDYGRSHINPELAIRDNNVYYDYELNREFDNFGEYQRVLFRKYVLRREVENDLKIIKRVEWHLHKLANRYIYKIELSDNNKLIEETFDTLEFKKGVLELYYNGRYEIMDNTFKIMSCDFGIDTTKSHKKYDFFRICRVVGGMILNINKNRELYSKNLWKNLGDKLELQFPYHDGWYYSLVSDYKPNPIGLMTDDDSFSVPMDVVYYLYNKLYILDQSGGGNMDEKIEKIKGKENEIMEDKNKIIKDIESKNVVQMDKNKLILEQLKKNLEKEKIKYNFMKIDYSDMNTGSFNINK